MGIRFGRRNRETATSGKIENRDIFATWRSLMDVTKLQEFGRKYTAAWCSQNAASVAAFFAEGASLKINNHLPAVGRKAIEAVAQDFMSAFPDMVVTMDGIDIEGDQVVYRWTLTGTNSGAGGTGQSVRISGHEKWTIAADGLIADSKGHFDDAEYNRQLKHGFAEGSENPGTRKSSSV
jgi:predicted ester cyclase